MNKHTPGPWLVGKEDDFDGLSIHASERDESWVPIANVPVDFDDRDEREANAYLISAAPELLEALKAARAILNPEISPNACAMADFAIAKANGE